MRHSNKLLLTFHVCLLSALVFQIVILNRQEEHFDNFSVARCISILVPFRWHLTAASIMFHTPKAMFESVHQLLKLRQFK